MGLKKVSMHQPIQGAWKACDDRRFKLQPWAVRAKAHVMANQVLKPKNGKSIISVFFKKIISFDKQKNSSCGKNAFIICNEKS